jgi:hypothetical protein
MSNVQSTTYTYQVIYRKGKPVIAFNFRPGPLNNIEKGQSVDQRENNYPDHINKVPVP